MYKKVTIELGGRPLTVETGRLAKQANGAALVTYGETVVLVTATAAPDARADIAPRGRIRLSMKAVANESQ